MTHHTDSDGNPLRHHRQASQAGDDQRPLLQLADGGMDATVSKVLQVAEQFLGFLERDDGYLKVKRDVDGDDVHFTWIWTLGPWTRHYVYVRFPYYQAGIALDLLEQKIAQVGSGLRRPTPDSYGR